MSPTILLMPADIESDVNMLDRKMPGPVAALGVSGSVAGVVISSYSLGKGIEPIPGDAVLGRDVVGPPLAAEHQPVQAAAGRQVVVDLLDVEGRVDVGVLV